MHCKFSACFFNSCSVKSKVTAWLNLSAVEVLFLLMAPHLVAAAVGGPHEGYTGHTTIYVLLTSILAASGGLMFGYDIGISGSTYNKPAYRTRA